MRDLGLLESDIIPAFEEATQMATHFLDIPIGLLGLMTEYEQKLKSAVGLSRLGPRNPLATVRQMPRLESFCTHVVDSHQVLVVPDTFSHPAFETSALTHQYGIRAYLGVPMIAANGCCVGTLAVMDQKPREFTQRDIEFLQLTARWSMSEFERQHANKAAPSHPPTPVLPPPEAPSLSLANQLKQELLAQLTQELRTPLTSVMGMASVLLREIYGPLTGKQKEYLDIIHNSGQYLLSLVNEILELAALKDGDDEDLHLTSVDIEMLSQQAISSLELAANRRDQKIRLSVEPGNRIWLLDREKVRQILYHLTFSVIQASNSGSTVRLHISHKHRNLNIAAWVSHPWLGEGLSYTSCHIQASMTAGQINPDSDWGDGPGSWLEDVAHASDRPVASDKALSLQEKTCSDLGLLLCQQLAEAHGGQLTIQNVAEAGYRYVVVLPRLTGNSQRREPQVSLPVGQSEI
jgi:signal transduction histidine kinase